MREYYSPWTHLFAQDVPEPQNFPEPTGGTLLRDYRRAKGDKPYAGLSNDVLNNTNTYSQMCAHPRTTRCSKAQPS